MSRTTSYAAISATVFGIISLAHLARLVFGWPVEIAHGAVPGWISAIAWLAAGGLCVWGFRLARVPGGRA